MFSFPESSKKIVIIFLCIVIVLFLGTIAWLFAAKIQAKDPLKYMSSLDLLGVAEIHNTDGTKNQWNVLKKGYVSESAYAALLGVDEAQTAELLNTLPEKTYLLFYKDGGILAFAEDNNLAQRKLVEALKHNFSVFTQDGYVFAGNASVDAMKDHVYVKNSEQKRVADSISRSLFDTSSIVSFASSDQSSLALFGDTLISQTQESTYKIFARDILSSLTAPVGNLFVTDEGYLTMTGKIQAPKDELAYFIQRDKLNMEVFKSLPSHIQTVLAFVVEPNLADAFGQYFKEQKTEALGLSWQYLMEAFVDKLKVVETPGELMKQAEKASVAFGMTSSGGVLVSVNGIDNAKADKVTDILLQGAKKNLSYEEITTTLPDKTKAVMLERHPEIISLQDSSNSGSYLKEIKAKDKLLVKIAGKEKTFVIADGNTSTNIENSQYTLLEKYFIEPSQWFAKLQYGFPIGSFAYLSDAIDSEKMKGNVYLSVSAYTDGLSYRILFEPHF